MTTSTRERARPSIDPRIKERRMEVKRREGRRRLRILIALLIVVVLAAGAAAATRSPLLNVDRVVIAGTDRTAVADVIKAASLDRDRLMVDVHAGAMASSIKRLPWVDDVHVERHWPGTVRIAVRERIPVATMPGEGGGWAVADVDGRVLARIPEAAEGLTRIEGGLPAGSAGSVVARQLLDALAVARALPPVLRERTPVVALTPEGLELRLVPSGVAKLGDRRQLDAKLDAVLTVLRSVNTERLAVLDVRVPGAPVLTRA